MTSLTLHSVGFFALSLTAVALLGCTTTAAERFAHGQCEGSVAFGADLDEEPLPLELGSSFSTIACSSGWTARGPIDLSSIDKDSPLWHELGPHVRPGDQFFELRYKRLVPRSGLILEIYYVLVRNDEIVHVRWMSSS
jgi:hypothetical protein